jgi:hypothetical protein
VWLAVFHARGSGIGMTQPLRMGARQRAAQKDSDHFASSAHLRMVQSATSKCKKGIDTELLVRADKEALNGLCPVRARAQSLC